jgi:hypothetical protein
LKKYILPILKEKIPSLKVYFVLRIVLTYSEKKNSDLKKFTNSQCSERTIIIEIGKNNWDLETCRKR